MESEAPSGEGDLSSLFGDGTLAGSLSLTPRAHKTTARRSVLLGMYEQLQENTASQVSGPAKAVEGKFGLRRLVERILVLWLKHGLR